MTPAEYLALWKATAQAEAAKPLSATSARAYAAMQRGATAELFLSLHTQEGKFEALPYSGVQLISSDQSETFVRVRFAKAALIIQGQQLAPILDALRTRTAAHLYAWQGGRHDLPEPGRPIIQTFSFATQAEKTAA